MKIIVLAAGQGQRLRPHTDNKPKCMVEFKGKPIIDYIIENTKNFNFEKVVVVNGYKKEVLEKYLEKETITFYTNNNFDSSNMVTSLFCAESELNDDIIISYSDIVYKREVLEAIYNSKADISVIIDKKWKELWQLRMENPLSDAETLKLDENSNILELGKKAKIMMRYKDNTSV